MKPIKELFSQFHPSRAQAEFFEDVSDYTVARSKLNSERFEISVTLSKFWKYGMLYSLEEDICKAYDSRYHVRFLPVYPQEAYDAALPGAEAMRRLAEARVLVVGVGGVGSWCAEALVRTGLGHITLVDDDVVAESNVNRQCPATAATIGRPKVEAMAERLVAINPACEIEAVNARYPSSSVSSLRSFDLVVDAIDSVDCKAELILNATEAGVPLVSSMGAALRIDPTTVKVTRFEKVEGDGLAKALRQRFKKLERWPKGKFSCVWSGEQPILNTETQRHREGTENSVPQCLCVKNKGSLMQVTAVFGMCLASEAIRILTKGETK